MKHWFTADCHFGHFNIIRYTNRPFKTLEEMDSVLIKNWNARVKPEDVIYHLGDFCFKNTPGGKIGEGTLTKAQEYEKLLNGKVIHITGNHDTTNKTGSIIESAIIRHGGVTFNLVHNPENANNAYTNLVGHIHEKWKHKNIKHGDMNIIYVNVGVDVWNFMPIDINEILKYISKVRHGRA